MEGLTEGRNVHFVNEVGQHHAAIVAKILNRATGMVNLAVFDDNGVAYNKTSVRYEEADPQAHVALPPNTWHWIERA